MVEDIDSFLEREKEKLEMEEEKLEEIVNNQLESDLHSPESPKKIEKPEDLELDSEIHEKFKEFRGSI